MSNDLISIKKASKALGVAAPTLYMLAKQRRIPTHRFGDRILVDLDEVRAATKVPTEHEPLLNKAKDGVKYRRYI